MQNTLEIPSNGWLSSLTILQRKLGCQATTSSLCVGVLRYFATVLTIGILLGIVIGLPDANAGVK
jgi:hypothetical protein